MNDLLEAKFVSVTPPGAKVDNASWTTASVDTRGFDHCTFVVYLGDLDIAMTAFKVQESSNDSDYSDITGATLNGGTDTAGTTTTLPSATDDNKIYLIHVDMRGRKRYLDLVITGGDGSTGTYLSAMAILSKREQLTSRATSQFCNGSCIVV